MDLQNESTFLQISYTIPASLIDSTYFSIEIKTHYREMIKILRPRRTSQLRSRRTSQSGLRLLGLDIDFDMK
jgi:hypothetical protein